jgi:hypothetical protein
MPSSPAERIINHGANLLKLVFLSILFFLGISAASASERYTEVWNPPESQGAKATKAKPHAATQTASKKKRKASTTVKQVADKTASDPQMAAPRAKASPKQSEPVIPRKIEPNGQVMRV